MADDDKTRTLGVVECFQAVILQCPSGAVRKAAEGALKSVERDGADALATQAYIVLSAVRGWQGPRAEQVKRSLATFLDDSSPASD